MQLIQNRIEDQVQPNATDVAAFRFTQAGFNKLAKLLFCYTDSDYAHGVSFQTHYGHNLSLLHKSQLVPYEIHLDEWLQTPVRFPEDKKLSARILSALQELEKRGDPSPLFGSSTYEENLEKLDEAIFDLYGLSDEQKDLIRDFCNVTLEFYYEGSKAEALKAPSISELERYSEAFLEVWRDRLKKRGKELEVNIFAPKDALLCGISFELKNLGRAKKRETVKDNAEWKNWLNRLSTSLRAKLDSGIYVDKVFKELTDSSMLIIKRAERRLWTKSQARQDAHELLTEVFKLEWQQDKSVA